MNLIVGRQNNYKEKFNTWGSLAQWLANVHPDPAAPGSIPSIPVEKLSMLLRLINGTAQRKVNSVIENVDRTHLVLASGKLVLKKILQDDIFFFSTFEPATAKRTDPLADLSSCPELSALNGLTGFSG